MVSANFRAYTNSHSALTASQPVIEPKHRTVMEDTTFEELEQAIYSINLDDDMLISKAATTYVMTPDHLKVPIKIPEPYKVRLKLATFNEPYAPGTKQLDFLKVPSSSNCVETMDTESNKELDSADVLAKEFEFLNGITSEREDKDSSIGLNALVTEMLPPLSLHGVFCYHLNAFLKVIT